MDRHLLTTPRILRRALPLAVFVLLIGARLRAFASDETSNSDKQRILYSSRFTFADSGVPLVTVEIMSGQKSAVLRSEGGLVVLPEGAGGPRIDASDSFRVRLGKAQKAKLLEWTVVATFLPSESKAIGIEVSKWKKRGHKVDTFDIGTLFAVEGTVMDTRRVRVAVDPVSAPKGEAHARGIAQKYDFETEVHAELVRRPQGSVIATSGDVTITNPSVLWFAPAKAGGTVEVANVTTGHGGSQLLSARENRRYFGSVYVTVGQDGALTVANAVTASDLLAGLVPSEIFPSAPAEALKAQSVAARTELLQKLGTRHLGDPFLLCASQHCQVYSGAGNEHPKTSKAIKATRGLVLMESAKYGGGLVDARYSAACGGHGEHKHVIWGGERDKTLRGRFDSNSTPSAFKTGVTSENLASFLALDGSDAYCGATPFSKNRYRWTASVSASDLSRKLSDQGDKIGNPLALTPLKRGVSGRVVELKIQGTRGSVVIYGDLTIRRLLGGLRSSLFKVTAKGSKSRPTSFEFKGAGFGHGVGMCQVGAIGMAQKGSKFRSILSHYYKNSSLSRMY